MRAAKLESRVEELGVLRSFSRPRVSNDNPYSESMFRTVKYRPDYPRKPFTSKGQACQWVAEFVDWYNHRHRHSGIKYVTPIQRHADQPSPLASSVLRSMRTLAEQIQHAGADTRAAGVNQKRCGLTSQARNPIRSWSYLGSRQPDWQPRSDTFPESHRPCLMAIPRSLRWALTVSKICSPRLYFSSRCRNARIVVSSGIRSLSMSIPAHRGMVGTSIRASSIAGSLSDYHCCIRWIRSIVASG